MCFGYATVVHIATCMHVLVSTVYIWEVCRGYSFYAVAANCKCFSTCFTSRENTMDLLYNRTQTADVLL